jgi:SAM-dependent methyltransferase
VSADPRATVPDWLNGVLACPRCHGPVAQEDAAWSCPRCGPVGEPRLGFADFLRRDRALPLANHDQLDLAADEALAQALHERRDELDFAGLRALALAARARDAAEWPARRRRTLERFHGRLAVANAAAGARHGPVLLAKVDARLAELGWPPLPSGLALEAGGGEGWYALGFSARFQRVIFVDAALSNLVLAAKLADEQGRTNIAFVRADVTELPIRTGACDLVHQNGVIEHVHDPDAMVRESARVRGVGGYYVCVSPNRLSLMPEPHFGIPGFGFVPAPVRRRLIPALRGFESEAGTDLRTLWALRRHFRRAGERRVDVFFLPSRFPATARQTNLRRLVRAALGLPLAGRMFAFALNRVLLPVVPQHIALARGDGAAQ